MRKWQTVLVSLVLIIGVAVVVIIEIGFFLSPQDSLRSAEMIVAVSCGETQQRADCRWRHQAACHSYGRVLPGGHDGLACHDSHTDSIRQIYFLINLTNR